MERARISASSRTAIGAGGSRVTGLPSCGGSVASAKEKRIRERLEQIKAAAAEMNAATPTKGGITGADLAEEAAGLGLDLLEDKS
jgi:hypothetical protein